MKAIRKLVATTGEYKKDGETKKRYQRMGTMFKDDDGRFSLKIDCIPVGPEWSGWVSLYEMDNDQRQDDGPTTTRNAHERHGESAPPPDGGDIPF